MANCSGAIAPDYGVYDIQCAVFVLDKDNPLQFAEYVPVIGNEANFIQALSKIQNFV